MAAQGWERIKPELFGGDAITARSGRAGRWSGRSSSRRETAWPSCRPVEVGPLKRRVRGLNASETRLMLEDWRGLLAELQRPVMETKIEGKITCIWCLM